MPTCRAFRAWSSSASPASCSRIAALVLRNRTDARFPMLRVEGDRSGYGIDLPQAWLDENPLAAAALDSEARNWEAVDLRFSINSLSEKKVAQLRG